MRSLDIAGRQIHDAGDVYVIAEIGHNHQGQLEQCKQLFKAAKAAGADAVKLQKRDNRALFTKAMYDSAYNSDRVRDATSITIEIVRKFADQTGFIVHPRRWVVERTFGWFNFFRRLSKDYERKVQNSESMILLAQIQILLCRLDKKVT